MKKLKKMDKEKKKTLIYAVTGGLVVFVVGLIINAIFWGPND